VIRGNPWGLDSGAANDDWAYVIFDWDNHFGALMLSLDAAALGYSALVQVVKARTREGFVPNTAASVNKARHSQPPVGSRVLLQMWRKRRERWIVELLYDDLLDWNNWFDAQRRLKPLGIGCLGSAEGSCAPPTPTHAHPRPTLAHPRPTHAHPRPTLAHPRPTHAHPRPTHDPSTTHPRAHTRPHAPTHAPARAHPRARTRPPTRPHVPTHAQQPIPPPPAAAPLATANSMQRAHAPRHYSVPVACCPQHAGRAF
jgi:hypothetical protein